MRALVVFYSRTGHTKRIAEKISKTLNADTEELYDTKGRKGIIGWIVSGMDARLKRKANLRKTEKAPSLYDLVILGTPTWANTLSTPIRSYIHQNSDTFKKVAFFVTSGFGSIKSAMGIHKDMQNLCGKEPIVFLSLGMKDIEKEHVYKIEDFVSTIKSQDKTLWNHDI